MNANRQAIDPKPPESVDELLAKFEAAEFSWQQGEIAQALVASGDKTIIPKMEKHLDVTERKRRCNAGFVLAGLGDKRGLEIIIRELEDKTPRPAVPGERRGNKRDPAGQIKSDRGYAAWFLGRLRNKEAVPALIEATTDETINLGAALSLGEIGDKSAIPALRKMVAEFPRQRLWAGYGLAALGQQDGFDLVTDVALSDPLWTERRHAVELLGKTGDSRALPTLVKALRDKHSNVRVSAAQALGQIGDPAALPALTEALRDTDFTETNAPTTVAKEARKAIEAIRKKM